MERMENISGPCVSDRIHFEGGEKKKKNFSSDSWIVRASASNNYAHDVH